MDLELSDDQVALRDGIASMLAARVPIERVRAGFDRALFDELAAAGVFSLRADGFSWADCVVVFEQLGRFCVPGPLVAVAAARRRPDRGPRHRVRRRSGSSISTRSTCCSSSGTGESHAVDPATVDGEPSPWPLDPCTPGRRASSGSPRARPIDVDDAPGALRGHRAHRRAPTRARRPAHRARGRVREGARAVRPADRLVPGDQAHARRHAHAHRGRARRGLQRGRGPRRGRRSRHCGAGSSTAPRSSPATPRSPTARPRRRCSAAWASRGRSTCTST